MLIAKYFHITFMAIWFVGLFFLPRLFLHQTRSANRAESDDALKQLGRPLYFGIMTPSAILTVAFGIWLIAYGYEGGWLPVKLALVLLLVLFHLYCGALLLELGRGRNRHGLTFYRLLNWVPLGLLSAIVALAVAKPELSFLSR